MPPNLERRLAALEQHTTPPSRDAELSAAAERLEAKLLAQTGDPEGEPMTEIELQEFIEATRAHLRGLMQRDPHERRWHDGT